MAHIPGPISPISGFIYGKVGHSGQAYETGKGVIQLRASAIIRKRSKG